MKDVMSRLAYDAFILLIERDMIHLRSEFAARSPGATEEHLNDVESFFTELQSILNRCRNVSIDYDAVWGSVLIAIRDKLDLSHYVGDSSYMDRYNQYLALYYDIDCQFVVQKDMLDDTLAAVQLG